MKIEHEVNGIKVSLEVPEPIQQDGKWWEFREFRYVKSGDRHKYEGSNVISTPKDGEVNLERWIATEIPCPTLEQLKTIGKRCGERPVMVKDGNVIWDGLLNEVPIWQNYVGKHRFVLEDVPVEREVHTSCEGCTKHATVQPCMDDCIGYRRRQGDRTSLRRNYTPKQPPPSEPRFPIGNIEYYLRSKIIHGQSDLTKWNCSLNDAIAEINDSDIGIAATTERNRGL